MVNSYHDNDDLHGRVHVRSFLLEDKWRENGKHGGYGTWRDIVYEVASKIQRQKGFSDS